MNVLIPLLPTVLLGAFDFSAPATLRDQGSAPVVVVNRSAKEITVQLSASGYSAAGSDGGMIQDPIVLQWEAGAGADGGRASVSGSSLRLHLAIGEVAYVKAMLNPGIPGGVPAGYESAYLTAYEEGVESVIQKEIKLPALSTPIPVKPSVGTWNVTATCQPWARCDKVELLPVDLDTSETGVVVVPTGVLARLYNERGDVANLQVNAGAPDQVITASSREFFDTEDGTVRLRTQVESIDLAGAYVGKLKLGGSDVNVTLSVSHPWYYMLLVTALGALVFLAQRSLSIYRGVASFHTRAGALLKKSAKAQETFAGTVRQIPGASGYDLHADIEAWIRQGKRDIAAEARRAREPIDETTSEAFKRLMKLEEAVDAWPDFAERLVKLGKRVEELSSKLAGDPRGKSSRELPALLVQSQNLLKGSALSVEEFSERSTRVTVAMDVLGRWETLNEQVNALLLQQQEIQTNAAKLPEADQQKQQAVLKDTGDTLQKLWQDLWIKELPTALQEIGSRVDQVKESLKRLKLPPGTPQVTPAMALESMIPLHSFGLPAPQAAGARRPVLAAPHGFWAELGHWFWNLGLWLRSVFMTDLLLILIALALASFFQLNSTYLGHSWGEPKDYIAAFIAGYGSQGLVSVLDAITGRQLASMLQSVVRR